MTGLQRLCLAALAVVFALIVIGVAVRATGSGLGCPEWPRCNGSFIPRWEKHTLIEYSHRLTATIAGCVVLGVAVAAWRGYRRVPAVLYPAAAAFVLVLAQAGLGGATVLGELPPELVALHLGLAMTLLALLVLTTTAAFAYQRPLDRPPVTAATARLSAAAAACLLPLMLVGAYMAGAGYSLACSGWPLCNGEVVPATSVASVGVHFLHRLLALVTGILIVALVLTCRQQRERAPLAWRLSVIAFVLFCLQALVGAANIWTEATDVVQIAHLVLGTILWGVVVYLNVRVHALHALLPAYERRQASETGLAGAIR